MLAHPRAIYVIYVEPLHRLVFKNSGLWELLHDGSGVVIYRMRQMHDEQGKINEAVD